MGTGASPELSQLLAASASEDAAAADQHARMMNLTRELSALSPEHERLSNSPEHVRLSKLGERLDDLKSQAADALKFISEAENQ